jgi:hypothetical protein
MTLRLKSSKSLMKWMRKMLKNSTLSVEIFYTNYQTFGVFRVIFGKFNGVEFPRHLTK